MMKIIKSIVLAVMFIYAMAVVTIHAQAAETEPLKVGVKQPYDTINEAIASAKEGQVIQIVGNVTETNPANPVLIDKKVIIQGDGQGGDAPVYTVKTWGGTVSPFQIAETGVIIQDLNIVINGAATTCSPIEITGDDLSLKRTSITLTGTDATVFAPIAVNASGLTMEDVTIPSTKRAPVLVDLRGNSATFKEVSLTAAANTTGIYSAISPTSLVLDTCSFTASASAATLVSLPSPDGLTLTDCTFSFHTAAGSSYGLNFTEASAAAATKTLKANGCVFHMNAVATAIHLNGYNGVFKDCEFNYTKGGTAIFSQASSNADLIFADCAFYMGKNSGERPVSAKGLDLTNNEQGNIIIDGCTLVASCNPEAEVSTSAASALIINATNGTLRSLTIHDSTIALNAGATNATGILADAALLSVTNSSFKANARTARCVVVNGITNGNVSDNVFDIAQAGAMGLSFTDSNAIYLKNNKYNLSTAGTGASMTNADHGTSGAVVERNEINLEGQTSQGLLFEKFNRLDVKNGTTIKTASGSKSSAGIKANQIETVEIDGLELDLNGVTQGVVIDGTKFPQGKEGTARITNTTSRLSGGASKAISVIYADGVQIDNYYGICDDTAANSVLLSFNSSIGVNISNSIFELYKTATGINVAAATTVTEPRDENGLIKKHVSGNYKIGNNGFYVGEKAKAIFFGGKNTHYVAIHDNLFKANHAAGIVNVGYGRCQFVYHNIFDSVNSMMAIVSDGVDEIASFTMEADDDIYEDGDIVDAYRNQFYNNRLTGSYERGFYITNNGDVIRDNDFSRATFHYEANPGIISNTQIIVAYCKDVKIVNNQFTKARAPDNQVIRINNAILSEVTGNTTQPVDGAPEVLFVQGSQAVAPNSVKYPERVEAHDVTNTINGITPIEITRAWNDPENLIYEYILRIPKHPYTVAYYKDSVSDENLLAVEQGYSEFAEGHILKSAEVAADLGVDWLVLHRPDSYADNTVSNINRLMIQSNPMENVVIVVYLPDALLIDVTEPAPSYIQPSVQRRVDISEPNEMYIEIDENEVPLTPPPPKVNPNPQTGKSETLSLYIGGPVSLIIAAFSFWLNQKRKQTNHHS